MKRRDFIKNTALTAGSLLATGCIDRHDLWDSLTTRPNNIYAATFGELSISTNGGVSFANRITADGLGNNTVQGVFVL